MIRFECDYLEGAHPQILERLKEKYSFAVWEKMDDSHSVVRFCTSWAAREEAVDELIRDIEAL